MIRIYGPHYYSICLCESASLVLREAKEPKLGEVMIKQPIYYCKQQHILVAPCDFRQVFYIKM